MEMATILFWPQCVKGRSYRWRTYILHKIYTRFPIYWGWLWFWAGQCYPHPSGFLHWLCGVHTFIAVPVTQRLKNMGILKVGQIWTGDITAVKQSTAKRWAYFVGYTVTGVTVNRIPTAAAKHLWRILRWRCPHKGPMMRGLEFSLLLARTSFWTHSKGVISLDAISRIWCYCD